MPSLPGAFGGSIPVRIPLPLQVGPFKLEVVQSEGNTGGSLISFGMKFGSGSQNKIQLFRLDYHGNQGTDADATYFQLGPRAPGESHDPWFHYHTPNY